MVPDRRILYPVTEEVTGYVRTAQWGDSGCVLIAVYCEGGYVKGCAMGGWGTMEGACRLLMGERDHLEELGVYGRIML